MRAAGLAFVLCATLALALAHGCGTPVDGGAASAADDGEYPIPAPPGGSLQRSPTPKVRLYTYPAESFGEIAAFYEGWIAESNLRNAAGPASVRVDDAGGQISTSVVDGDQLYQVIATRDGGRIDLVLRVNKM